MAKDAELLEKLGTWDRKLLGFWKLFEVALDTN
jgi:hypothetical protein